MSNEKEIRPEYISVGELSVGFSENIIPFTEDLAGQTIVLNSESGKKFELLFADGETLKIDIHDAEKQEKYICRYSANCPRPGIYFIDFIVSYGFSQSFTVILDKSLGIATVFIGTLPSKEEMEVPILEKAQMGMPLTAVKLTVEHACLNKPFTNKTPKHEKTKDLIGKRMQFVYSSKDAYEHIYLNENRYCWHCVAGSEKGLADTDWCCYYKLADEIYCFLWLEKIIPTIGIVIEDMKVMRSYGKLFGYEDYEAGKISNFPVGSYATFLNQTTYNLERITVK